MVKKTLRISVTVYTQYRRVTDGRTDRQTDGQTDILLRHSPRYAYASRGKNASSASYSNGLQYEPNTGNCNRNISSSRVMNAIN